MFHAIIHNVPSRGDMGYGVEHRDYSRGSGTLAIIREVPEP